MNFKTTLVLLVLVAAGGVLVFVGRQVPSLFESKSAPPDLGTRAALDKLKAEDLTKIEIQHGTQTLTLTREGGAWNMPGRWRTRTTEVNALVALLGGLRSRFEAIPISDNTDLSLYGLDKPAATVKLETEHAKYQFVLGDAPATSETNQFSRPTYLRLLNGPNVDKPAEIVQLGPGLLALLEGPADYYQQRHLFESKREADEDQPNVKTSRLTARSVRVEEHKKKPGDDGKNEDQVYTVERKDKTWELSVPERDRLDPDVAKALLAALPDLWAEHFVDVDVYAVGAALSGDRCLGGGLTALGWLAMTTPEKSPAWLTLRSGLATPERKIIVTDDNGAKMTLLIGAVANSRTKIGARPTPPGLPMQPPEVTVEEYRYAKLEDNPRIFEIKGEPLKSVFVSLDKLRDARLARFNANEATELEIAQPDKETIQVVKEKDRWKLVKPFKADADTLKVSELLTRLSGLQVHGEDIVAPDAAAQGFDKPSATITVKWETEKKGPDGDKKKTPHTATLTFGKDDAEKKKLYVKSDDWPRVNAVEDSLAALTKRPALAYRGKRLLDFAAADIEKIDVERGADKLSLKRGKDGWQLAAPVQAKVDAVKVEQLADELGRLEVIEYVDDAPQADKLDETYGVGKSAALVVTVTSSDGSKPRTLRFGKSRGTKPEYYAKMDDAPSVFVVDALIHGQLDRDALAYLPAELWQMSPAEVGGVRVKKEGQDEYTVKRAGDKWQISGPFDAPALPQLASFLAEDFAAVRCESHKALNATDLGKYGLDKPYATITVLGKDGKEVHTLLIGAPVEKDSHSRFAKVADRPGVCAVGEPYVEAADQSALALLDPTLLRLDAAKVERITTKSGDKTLTLQRKEDGWEVLDTPASPFPADKDAMGPGLFFWANLRADKFDAYGAKVDWAKYGLVEPAAVVTVKMKDGEPKEHTIKLGKFVNGDSGPRYARVDENSGVAVLNSFVALALARPYLDYVNRDVLHFKGDDVMEIQRQMGAETLEITHKGDGWQIVKPSEQRADDKSLQDLVGQLANLKAVRVVAFPATDLKTYGLDAPAAVITIKLKPDAKPAEYVVKLGKPTEADGAERFALVGDGKAVVVLPAELSRRLAAAPITFRDRSIARFADADKLRLERGPRQAVFARVEGSWKLTEPIAAAADNDELDDFLNTLAKLRADELVAEKPTAEELKTYGLDKPEARWKLMAGDQVVLDLIIGGREKVGIRRYAQLAGKDIVFLLDPKLSMRCLAEFRTRTVWPGPLDAVQIESIRYGYAKNPFTLVKTPGGWQVEGKPEVKPNTATVNETLAALAGLKVSRYVVDKGADFKLFGLEPPELVIEITSRTGTQTLHIGRPEGDSKRLYARVPGKDRSDVFVIDEADAARILRDVTAFTKAPERPIPPMN